MASKAEIINAIEALTVHCRPPLMEANQRTSWLSDWCDDLGRFPAEAIANGCRKWRHSGNTKFPTPGQLLPLVGEGVPNPDRVKALPWRPATQEEYQAMTLKEKIRENLILASEADGKAGPQFRNTSQRGSINRAAGVHLTPEQMPPEWHRWRDVAATHRAEAGRLRKHLYSRSLEAAE